MNGNEPISIQMKFLKECDGELVLAKFGGDNVDWAIVGQEKNAIVVSGKDAPRRIEITASDAMFSLHCLSYGKHFLLLPEYTSAFTVAERFPAGTLVCAREYTDNADKTNWYLSWTTNGTGSARWWFLNLGDFSFRNVPGDMRAGFSEWAIWAPLPSQPHRLTKLYQHPPSVR